MFLKVDSYIINDEFALKIGKKRLSTGVLDRKQVFLSYVWQDIYFYDRECMTVQPITFIKSQLIIFVDFFKNYFFPQIFIVFPQKITMFSYLQLS